MMDEKPRVMDAHGYNTNEKASAFTYYGNTGDWCC